MFVKATGNMGLSQSGRTLVTLGICMDYKRIVGVPIRDYRETLEELPCCNLRQAHVYPKCTPRCTWWSWDTKKYPPESDFFVSFVSEGFHKKPMPGADAESRL